MAQRQQVSRDEARRCGDELGLDWTEVDFDQFHRGLEVELEHGARDAQTDVTHDDMVLTGKIAWAHLKESPDYYTRLDRMEAEADAYWASRRSPEAKPGSEAPLNTPATQAARKELP